MFHDPDTLYLFITLFFAVAAASVAFASATLGVAVRDLRRPAPAQAGPVARHPARSVSPQPARHAA